MSQTVLVTRILLQRSQVVRAEAKAAREDAYETAAAVWTQMQKWKQGPVRLSLVTPARLAVAKLKISETAAACHRRPSTVFPHGRRFCP